MAYANIQNVNDDRRGGFFWIFDKTNNDYIIINCFN